MQCLNLNNKEVKAAVDELTAVLGSENAAYYIISENNGYAIDLAPNGALSKLFSDLLEQYNGDREQAIKAKAKTFTEDFKNLFGDWLNTTLLKLDNDSVDYLFGINPELEKIGTKDEYKLYLNTIFPNSKVSEVYWHGTDSDFSEGIQNTKKSKGSGAPETKGEMYFNRQPWASLLYISGVNRKNADKNGFRNWVKLWWELKEILGNGRMENDDWKNIVVGPDIRLEIPNKKGVFNRNQGGNNGKYLSERKADYGYENKSDKEFFEEVFGIKYGEDTFQDWVNRNANIFKLIWDNRLVKKGIYPALLNVLNPIVEEGQNTYYEEQRGLMTLAKKNGNDAIVSNKSKNEFGSDVIIILNPLENVHILGTREDILLFKEWKQTNSVSKVVDENGEPKFLIKSIDNSITSSTEDNNIYYKGWSTLNPFSSKDHSQAIELFTDTRQLLQYVQTLDVSPWVKRIAAKLELESTGIEFEEKSKSSAAYNGKVILYKSTYSSRSDTDFASDVLHEMIHHYLQKKYDEDSTLRKILDTHQLYYRDNIKNWKNHYGLTGDSSEFLSEVMSNTEFHKVLRKQNLNQWKLFLNKIAKFLGLKLFEKEAQQLKKNKEELKELIYFLENLLDQVNENIIEHYNSDNYTYVTKYKDQSKIDKSLDKIRTGIKLRLASIKRYLNKNLDIIHREEKLLDDLNKLDSAEGIVEFVNYVNDTISDAFKFLNENPEDINSKLLVQLKRDYLGFFMPMMRDILFITDTTSDLKPLILDYQDFKDMVDNIITGQTTLMNKYNNILRNNFRTMLLNYAIEHNSPTVELMTHWLDDPDKDLNWIEQFIGQNSSTNNEVIRIMADILSELINITKRNTYDKGVSIVDIYNKAKAANPKIDVMSMLLEKDDKGLTTGYFVRDRNYGKFYNDQKIAVDKIVADMKLVRDQDGVIQFESRVQEKEFRKRKLDWLLKHGELKYTADYYQLKYDLSIEAQDALDEIDTLTNNIISKARQGKLMLLNKLTKKDLDNLDSLSRQRAELYSEFYADGTPKSGTDLKIAKELQLFRKKLKNKIKYKKDYNRFNETARAIIAKYGSQSKLYSNWYNAATLEEYTDEFYELLDEVSINGEMSEEIQELRDQRSRLLNMYRDKSTRLINMEIPQLVKDRIIELDIEIARKSKQFKLESEIEDQIEFKDIAAIRKTEQYYKDAQIAKEEGKYEEWYAKNHYEVNGFLRAASYYTYMEPISNKFKQIVPNAYFSIVDLDSEFVNSNYDLDGEYVQPKKSLYDNSANFNAIQKNKELKALYDYLIDTMKESYSKISFMSYANPYRLPLISGRMMSIIARADDKFQALKYVVKDLFTVKDDDADYVLEFAYRNDGSRVKLIPTRYINMMDDPSKITSDVCGSVIQFFEMAENYKNMSAVLDDLEMVMYGLEDLNVKTKGRTKRGAETNVYKKAQDMLDMALYGEKKRQLIFGKYNLTKGLTKLYSYISLTNLANNIWAITANYATGLINLDIEAVAGRYFSASDIHFAKMELARRLPDITANIGNVNHRDKLIMLMQMNLVTRSNGETFDRLDQSSLLRALNQHFWYNGYTAGDFVIKSLLLMSTYHSYKYYNGEYLNKSKFILKYYPNARNDGERAFLAITDTLWDAYDVVDGKLANVTKGDRKTAADKMLKLVQKKINTLAVRIDGNITDTDRAAIHRNVITQFFVMHRNFMINGILERFKAKQFNYSTGEMEGGMYADVVKFVYHSVSKGKLNVIAQATAEWDSLDELERYNVKKVAIELANIIVWGSIISTLLVAAADDDPDDWALLALAYSATRISFEFRTLYNPFELLGILNSPSAAFSVLDNASNYLKLLWIPNYFDKNGAFGTVKSGVYKGWPKVLRNTLKITPFKNIYEATSVEGVKAKRNYLENLLMF